MRAGENKLNEVGQEKIRRFFTGKVAENGELSCWKTEWELCSPLIIVEDSSFVMFRERMCQPA